MVGSRIRDGRYPAAQRLNGETLRGSTAIGIHSLPVWSYNVAVAYAYNQICIYSSTHAHTHTCANVSLPTLAVVMGNTAPILKAGSTNAQNDWKRKTT